MRISLSGFSSTNDETFQRCWKRKHKLPRGHRGKNAWDDKYVYVIITLWLGLLKVYWSLKNDTAMRGKKTSLRWQKVKQNVFTLFVETMSRTVDKISEMLANWKHGDQFQNAMTSKFFCDNPSRMFFAVAQKTFSVWEIKCANIRTRYHRSLLISDDQLQLRNVC